MTNNTETSPLQEALNSLQDVLKFDAAGMELLSQIESRLKSDAASKKRLFDAVEKKYDFTTSEIDAAPFENFESFYEATLAQVGQMVNMAKTAGVKPEEMTYLKDRISAAIEGHYSREANRVSILSNLEVGEAQVAAALEPIVELAQRVLKIETPKTRFRPDVIQHVIEQKKALLAQLEANAPKYDASIEEAYQQEIAEEQEALIGQIERYLRNGYVDPSVEISPALGNYEDQLRYNLSQIISLRDRGSPHRRETVKTALEIETLRADIGALELSLRPIEQKTLGAGENLSPEEIREATQHWKEYQEAVKPKGGPAFHLMSEREQHQADVAEMKKFITVIGEIGEQS